MSNATKAIPKILVHEGGYVNNPNDPGGPTNKGITIATFRRYIKPNGTVADLKALTTGQAVVVYKRQYWDAVSADLLPSGVDYAVADFAVNSGPTRAAKYLQKIAGVSQDGRIGPATLAAVNAMNPNDVINRLCDDRLAFMKRIRRGTLWSEFGRGWARRVAEVRSVSLSWVSIETVRPVSRPPSPQSGWLSMLIALITGKAAQ
jgi:lysozyme family protein